MSHFELKFIVVVYDARRLLKLIYIVGNIDLRARWWHQYQAVHLHLLFRPVMQDLLSLFRFKRDAAETYGD